MFTRDVAKARIKKLEGDMLGLMHRLRRLSAQPGIFSNASQAFNAQSERATLNMSFQGATRIEEHLKLQISMIRDELTALTPYMHEPLEFKMSA
ncbi:MAG: hypothetical protein GW778_04775 [Alphaproteobacteria bacterium]|nr:hypothetical protein [Alphaproteobacteria bacterium]